MFHERLTVLREAGTVLIEKFGGKFSNCVRMAGKNSQKLLRTMVENFSSYRDESVFRGRKGEETVRSLNE